MVPRILAADGIVSPNPYITFYEKIQILPDLSPNIQIPNQQLAIFHPGLLLDLEPNQCASYGEL